MRTRITLMVVATVIFCALIFSWIGVRIVSDECQSSAAQIMNLTCLTSTAALNEDLLQIEDAVQTAAQYAADSLPDESVEPDSAEFQTYLTDVQNYFEAIASTQSSTYAFYYRYLPEIYYQAGFFRVSQNRDGSFEDFELTDIRQYDPDDTEHVGWYYIPKETGEPMWMEPYWNANDSTYTLSYVAPLSRGDGTVYGVVGLDLDFSQIQDAVLGISAYETGYAALLTADGTVVCHRDLEYGTDIAGLSGDLSEIVSKLSEESSGDTLLSCTCQGTDMKMAFSSLRCGLKLVLAVPDSEIEASRYILMRRYTMFTLAAIIGFLLIGFWVARHMTAPLVKLTDAARKIERGQMDPEFPAPSNDEIGILSETMQKMVKSMKQLVTGLSHKAYRDALTGVRNKGSYEEEVVKYDVSGKAFGLVMFDVNYLKRINDQYGHEKGDIYLKNTCTVICQVFCHCPVFRLGGDEFVAILNEENAALSQELLQEMDRKTEEVNSTAANPWERIDCAKGCALYDPAKEHLEKPSEVIFKRADQAMYRDKEGKRRE